MALINIANPEDLPDLIYLMQLWYRSSLDGRSKLDMWMIDPDNLAITLDHKSLDGQIPMFPSVCICGKLGLTGQHSELHRWCNNCYGKLGQWLPPLSCEAWIIEFALAIAIYHDHEEHPRW